MTNDNTIQHATGGARQGLPFALAGALLAVLAYPAAHAADTDWGVTSPSDRMPTESRIQSGSPIGSGYHTDSEPHAVPESSRDSKSYVDAQSRVGSSFAGGKTSYDGVARSRPSVPCRGCNNARALCGCNRRGALTGGLLENLSLFAGLEGSKQPQDFGVNANFGGRFHANLGIPLIESEGIGLQVGTSLNYTDNAVQVFERLNGYRDRFQNFTTVGLFQRADNGWTWAAGYDFLFQDSYDSFNLGQWRGDISYRLDRCNEFGTWFALRGHSDDGFYDTIPLTLRPITQGSLYWRQNWENDIQTTLWGGIADGHGEVNLALGDLEPTNERFVFGADVFVPISPKLAIFGQANFITPADSGTVDSFFGLAYFPGGSHGARDRRFAPRLSVANNTTFANDLRR